MSVDTLRETFHINRISNFYLQDFLTAQTYRPEITAAKKHILGLNNCTLQSVCTKLIQQGKSPKYSSEGLKCLKPRNTNTMLVSIDDIDWIDISTKEKIQNQRVSYGDILITRSGSGTIGRASIYPYKDDNVYVNDHLFIVRPDKADSHYVCSYLGSYFGQRLLEAGISGSTGQLNLSNQHIKSIRLFEPDINIQKYIGDKVRQAEQLRAWAKELRDSVDSQLDNLKLPINEPPQMINLMSAKDMEDRLDPRPYRSHYLKLTESIESIDHESISKITTLASGCPVSSKDFVENEGIPLVRIRNIGFDDFIGLDTGIGEDVYQDSAKYHAKEKMIVVGMDGIFRSQFFIADELPMLVNQRVAMLSPTNIRGELLTHWLNRPEGQMQLNQWAVKTTVEHTSLSDIGRILIPRLDKELEDRLADNLLSARLAYRYSKFLTQVAKTLVEALIEGQLTEEQLIKAQQALEDGDNTLDKAILSKLSSEGYAVEGAAPLFSDVDELYRLLASATTADSED